MSTKLIKSLLASFVFLFSGNVFADYEDILLHVNECRPDFVRRELDRMRRNGENLSEEVSKKKDEKTLLHILFENNSCNEFQKRMIAEQLIHVNSSLMNEVDGSGNPPLFSALIQPVGDPTDNPKENKNLTAMHLLIMNGADFRNKSGRSLLQEAIRLGDIEAFIYLRAEWGDYFGDDGLTQEDIANSPSIFQQVNKGELIFDLGHCGEVSLDHINHERIFVKMSGREKTLLLGCGNNGYGFGGGSFFELCKNNEAHRTSHVCVDVDAHIEPDIQIDVNSLYPALNSLGLKGCFDEVKSERCCSVSWVVTSLSFVQISKIVKTLKCAVRPGGLITIQMCCRDACRTRPGEMSSVFKEVMKMSGFEKIGHSVGCTDKDEEIIYRLIE